MPFFSYDETTDSINDESQAYNVMDLAGRICFSRPVVDNVSVGINAFIINSKLGPNSATGFGGDLGFLYQSASDLNLGLSIRDIGTGLKFIDQNSAFPMNITGGAKYTILNQNDHLKLSLAAYLQGSYYFQNYALPIGGGLEFGFNKMLFVRGGYLADKESDYGFSFGFGVNWKPFSVDYGGQMGTYFGLSQKLSLFMNF